MPLLSNWLSGTGGIMTTNVVVPANEPKRFYRVAITNL